MWKRFLCVLLFAGLCNFHSALAVLLTNSRVPEAAPVGLIVKFKSDPRPAPAKVGAGQVQTSDRSFNELAQRFNVASVEALDHDQENRPGPLSGVYRLAVSGEAASDEMLRAFESLPGVEYAEYDRPMILFELANDSLFGYQWSLANNGQEYFHVNRLAGVHNDVMVMERGTIDADIDADEVLAQPPDHTETVVVAIIDTGVDLKHPDLQGRFWQNPGEIPGNNFDDDHNGYVDDVIGWDFSANPRGYPIYSDNDPTDIYGHGTHCAGIVAAATGNEVGIAGIAPNCRIMALKFFPLLLISSAAEAIIYAADNGADVINMSFGSSFPARLMRDAVDYAHAKGVVLVAASGNSYTEAAYYPAAFSPVIAVGATDSRDHVTDFSTSGNHLDLCAPGNSILSLRAEGTDMYGYDNGDEPHVHIVRSRYYEASGTSMAAPHVVGVAAYLRSVSPGLTPDSVAATLKRTADDIVDPYGNGWNYPGWDKFSGYGRVNLATALAFAPLSSARITSPGPNTIITGTVDILGTAAGFDFSNYTLEYGLGSRPTQWHQIHQSQNRIENALLGQLATAGLGGPVSVRLSVGSSNVAQVTYFVANEARSEFSFPTEGDTLFGTTRLTLTAYCPNFRFAVVDYFSQSEWGIWKSIDTLYEPMLNEMATIFNSFNLPSQKYYLRLRVYSSMGLRSSDTISVLLNSLFAPPNGWRADLGAAPAMTSNSGDFDRDGVREIVVGTENGIKFYSPEGTPKTQGMPVFPYLDFRVPVPVGDLDGDGHDDIAAVSANNTAIYTYCSSGREVVVPVPQSPDVGSYYVTDEFSYPILSLVDIDRDGKDEITFYSGYGDEATTQVIDLYTDDGSPQVDLREFPGWCLAADLNGDGMGEIYSASDDHITLFNADGTVRANADLLPLGRVLNISAADVDGDNHREFVVEATPEPMNGDGLVRIYAFNHQLQLLAHYPKVTQVSFFWAPSPPVFGDLDGDGPPEMLISVYTDAYSFVYAYRLDGSPYQGDSNSTGVFAVSPWPAIIRRPLLVNIQGSSGAEVFTLARQSLFSSDREKDLFCWDEYGMNVPGWPIQLYAGYDVSSEYATTPVFGDIDNNGKMDVTVTTPQNRLLFANFESLSFDSAHSPCPMWRYNRGYNGLAPLWGGTITDVADDEADVLPSEFTLSQNYPNPFNLSTRIDFSLPATTDVRLSVFNALGQEVAKLWQGNLRAGRHQVYWDGRDKTGREVASGIYLLRLNTAVNSQTRKMVLLK